SGGRARCSATPSPDGVRSRYAHAAHALVGAALRADEALGAVRLTLRQTRPGEAHLGAALPGVLAWGPGLLAAARARRRGRRRRAVWQAEAAEAHLGAALGTDGARARSHHAGALAGLAVHRAALGAVRAHVAIGLAHGAARTAAGGGAAGGRATRAAAAAGGG